MVSEVFKTSHNPPNPAISIHNHSNLFVVFLILDMFTMKRFWINQPSTLQPLHKYHGNNVLAENINSERVYFTSGNIISMEVPDNVLSAGWLKTKKEGLECETIL